MKSKFSLFSLALLLYFFKSQSQITELKENFSTCVGQLPSGWIKYSVQGNETWQCTNNGYIGQGVIMSGVNGANIFANEDWLISPIINITGYSMPMLSFWCRNKNIGNDIQVMISYNYNGSGNPNTATWTNINAALPAQNADTWFKSDYNNMSAYKSQPFYLAFKYTSTATDATIWRIDETVIYESDLSISKIFANVGQAAVGSYSASKNFQFTMSNIIGTLELNAPYPFELSKDNINFSTALAYNNNASNIPQTVYVRIRPFIADKVYRDSILFVHNGITIPKTVLLLGTSIPDKSALRIISWNMRWFGNPSWCNCDTTLALNNAKVLMKDMDADIYCVQELVNVNQLAVLAAHLGPDYDHVVSPYCSGVTNPANGFYQTCQKLAYIYKKEKVNLLGSFGLLASTYPADTSVNSGYYCFSSGRFPFIFKAQVKLANNTFDTLTIANIHAKAGSTLADYDRRKCSVEKMTDSLMALFPNQKILILGDYNDYLEGSNVVGQTITPYKYLLDNGYTGISLPSKYPGQATYVGSTNHIIDNYVCSITLFPKYIDSSFFIFTESNRYISDYANTTSDHYPIFSYFKYNFPNAITDISTLSQHQKMFNIVNPSQDVLHILNNTQQNMHNVHISIYDLAGKVIFSTTEPYISTNITVPISNLQLGMYFVQIHVDNYVQTEKWIVQ